MILGFLLNYVIKQRKRKLEKYWMIYKLILIILSFLTSALVYFFLIESPHLIWFSRFTILGLGTVNVWALYRRPWPVRSKFEYEEDSTLPEFLFVLLGGLLVGIAYTTAPQTLEIVAYSVDVSRSLWDAPIVFVLPFLIFKLSDLASQVPFRTVENPWVFPLEKANPANWPWRDLMQVNFELKRSLLDEYNLFAWPARPWIEGPKEVMVGQLFRLAMQERRKNSNLTTIQDLGDEYDGAPRFVWIFSFKIIWYNPITWFRSPRFINPDLSVNQNKLQKWDVIVARRVPGDGTKPSGLNYQGIFEGDDSEKTVILK